MIWDAYRAIREKEDGSYETDGYLVIDHMGEGLCKVDEYGSDFTCLGSRFEQAGTISPGRYAIGDCFPNDGRAYVLMADTDMQDLLSARKALDLLNRMERREWGAESQGLAVSFFVRSFSGGKVRVADFSREGRMELRNEHSTLVRHFIGAVGREGLKAFMAEPERMGEEMFDRIGAELRELADKYDLVCGKDPNGKWVLAVSESERIRRVLLRLNKDKPPSGCIALSGDAPQIMEEYLRFHPCFTQEDAWALADDLNGLCGRMAPPIFPGEGKGHAGISSAIQLGDLFSQDALLALPHAAGARPVTTWEINQLRLRGTDAELRDCLIGFLRNADNTALGNGEAVRYLGEMAARYRMDTVRDMNGEKLREIARETLKRVKMAAVRRIPNQSREARIVSYDGWYRPDAEQALMVAEEAVSARVSGSRGIDR